MNKLDDLDRKLLNILQNDFPLAVDPFAVLADQLNCSWADLMSRIALLKEKGVIRRIGGIVDAGQMGYNSTLCACQVPVSLIEEFAREVNDIPNITHNYVREHELNVWFTLTTPNPEERGRIIQTLEDRFQIIIICMPAQKTYKLRVVLGME
jgi:DNA-binding Lrp family transcriptional regulator